MLSLMCGWIPRTETQPEPILPGPLTLSNDLIAAAPREVAVSPDEVMAFDWSEQQTLSTEAGTEVGILEVYIFRSKSRTNDAYEFLSAMESQEGVIPHSTPPLGDRVVGHYADQEHVRMVFARCRAVVTLLVDEEYAGDLQCYLWEVDARVAAETCP